MSGSLAQGEIILAPAPRGCWADEEARVSIEVCIIPLDGGVISTHQRGTVMSQLDGCHHVIASFRAEVKGLKMAVCIALFSWHAWLQKAGGELVLAQPGQDVARFLDGIDSCPWKVFASDDQALAYFGGEGGAAGVTARVIQIGPWQSAGVEPPGDD